MSSTRSNFGGFIFESALSETCRVYMVQIGVSCA
jgi:hypothetical protein